MKGDRKQKKTPILLPVHCFERMTSVHYFGAALTLEEMLKKRYVVLVQSAKSEHI